MVLAIIALGPLVTGAGAVQPTAGAESPTLRDQVAAVTSQEPESLAPDDPTAWQTVAGGDEVLALALDPREAGVLWAGTEGGGLLRWETGGAFRQWLFPNESGLAGNTVRDLAFDGEGGLWLVAAGGGVSHLAVDGGWRRFGAGDGLPAGLDLTAITVGRDGTVWVGSRDAGLARLAPGAEGWEAVVPDEAEPEAGPSGWQVADLAVAPDGALWVAHGRSGGADHPAFSIRDAASGRWRALRALAPGSAEADAADQSPATDQVMALTFDAEGLLWAGSWARGVLRFDGQRWSRFEPAAGVCGRNVWAVAAGYGEVWVACGQDASAAADRGGGVARWDGAAWRTLRAGVPGGLPSDDIVALAVGPDEVFMGTNLADGSGLGIVPWDRVALTGGALPRLQTAGQTPVHNDLTALAFTPDGALWVGTRAQGLMRYDGEAWTKVTRADEPGLAGDAITALVVGDGALYVGATKMLVQGRAYVDGGLSVLDLSTGAWRLLRAPEAPLPDNDVSSLAVAEDGRVWIGTGTALGGPGTGANAQLGDGLAVWDPGSGQWGFYTHASTGGRLPGDTVPALASAGPDLWAATSYATDNTGNRRGGGLARLNGLEWTTWVNGTAGFRTFVEPSTAVTGDLRAVMVDATGGVWAGTWSIDDPSQLIGRWPEVDAVVNRWTGSDWQAEVFREAGWVSALAQDSVDAGRIWAATSRGPRGEFSPSGAVWLAGGPGGLWLLEGGEWRNLNPANSGLASWDLTALAVEPATGHLWAASEHGGLSVYRVGAPLALPTPCVACPTPTFPPDFGPAEVLPATGPAWLWGLGGLVFLVVVAAVWVLWRRRRRRADGGLAGKDQVAGMGG